MANPFSKILSDSLAVFKKSSTDSVVGIDIGSSAIKVVQLKKKGAKAVLETYGALSLGPYLEGGVVGQTTNLPIEKVAQALTDVMREAGITTKQGAVSIPASASLVFLIELPAVIDESQLASIIPTEARKYIPVPISEVSLDWWPIPKKDSALDGAVGPDGKPIKESPKTEVLVAAIHNDTIQKYRDIIAKTNLSVDFFEIELFSSIRSSFGRELSTVLIIDMGALKTKLSIIEYGIVRKFHSIDRGSQDITNALSKSLGVTFLQAEQMKREFGMFGNQKDQSMPEIISLSVDYILSETNSAILNYERQYGKTISKVILTGGGVLLKGFKERATEQLRSEVVMAKPFDKVEAPAFLDNVLETAGPEFAVAAGLALRRLQESA